MPNNPPIAKGRKPKRVSTYIKGDIIYSDTWNKLRNAYREENPICERCVYLNRVTVTSTYKLSVHHIRMRNKYPDLVYDENNLLTLCTRCHGYFSGLENSGKESQSIKEGEEIKNGYIK